MKAFKAFNTTFCNARSGKAHKIKWKIRGTRKVFARIESSLCCKYYVSKNSLFRPVYISIGIYGSKCGTICEVKESDYHGLGLN